MAAVGDANAMISVAFTTTAEVSVLGLKLWPGATLSNGDVGKWCKTNYKKAVGEEKNHDEAQPTVRSTRWEGKKKPKTKKKHEKGY